MIKEARAQSNNVLVLDAGNALWSEDPLAQETLSKIMVEGMNLMGYDAMLLGADDLALGPELLRKRMEAAKFPFLSANVKLADSGELLAQPYTVLEKGGRKIGIIGVTSDLARLTLGDVGRRYTFLKPGEVLSTYVAEVAKETNTIVVLSNMGYEEDRRLSSVVSGISLIVGGRSPIDLAEGWCNEETGTVVLLGGTECQGFGRCWLHLDGSGVVDERSCELLLLTDEYPDDLEMRAFLDNYPAQ